jgi:hypothetical protein
VIVAAALLPRTSLARAASLSPDDAVGHVEEIATVCGVVASAKFAANSHSQPTFLDFDRAYSNAVFTAVISQVRNAREVALRKAHLCDGAEPENIVESQRSSSMVRGN